MTDSLVTPCTFFIEENPLDIKWRPAWFNRREWLNELLFSTDHGSSKSLAQHLKDDNHCVALALIDLDLFTAITVKTLNDIGVPVTAWLVLPEEQDYWSNLSNVGDTVYRVNQFIDWMEKNGLSFTGLGIDWEPPIQMHFSRNGKKVYPRAFPEYLKKRNFKAMASLQFELSYVNVTLGIETELYVMPSLLSWAFGLRQQPVVDRRVIMAYSTVLPELVGSTRLAYRLMCAGDPKASVAYGIASGARDSSPGRDFGGGKLPRHLTLQELARCIKHTPVANRKQPSYLFALNNSSVVHMWESAAKLAGD